MAINSIKFVISGSATATNGSDTITVTGNTDLRNVYSGSAVFLGTSQVVEAISGTAPDVNGNSTIKLRFPWTDPTTTGKLVVFNTIEGLAEAIRRAREVVGQVGGSIEAFDTVLTATSETVTVTIGAEDITVTPYGYIASQSETLILDLQNAVGLVDGLEQDVVNLTADVASQQGIVNTNLAESNAAKDAAELAADNAAASAITAESAKANAQASAAAALVSETNAATSENNASASALSASNSKVAAATSESNAATSESNAATSESNAATSAANALASEQAASLSASSASSSKNAAQTSAANAATSAVTAEAAKVDAQSSAAAALVSKNNAATSENNASASALAASNSEEAAATSESNAATSAANALASEQAASLSASSASSSKNAAQTSAANAQTSATNAAASAVTAEAAKADALVSETNAATSENNALASALSASNSEEAASTSAANALASEQAASLSASSASSSKNAAQTSATNAQTSATNAQTSATNAAASAATAEAAKVDAQDAQSIALANANFAGAWSNQTGSKSPPYSVRHEPSGEEDAIWMLNNPIANIGLSEPSASNPDWFVIGVISASSVTSVNGLVGAVTLTKSDVGLANVDNTSDAAKPISTATQTALNNKVDKVTGKQLSTEDYTSTEKTKLAGIAPGATANTGTVTSVAMSVPTGLSVAGSPISTTGTLAVTFASGYSIPTTTKQANWDTAFGWGNHASVGYLTSLAHTHGVANAAGTQQFTFGVNENIRFAASGAASIAFDPATKTITVSSTNTNTTYTAGTGLSLTGTQFSLSGVSFTSADKTKLDGIAAGAQVNVATNLGVGTRTTTAVPITSSTGTSATLPVATTTLAGVMSSADKTKLDGIAAGAQVNTVTSVAGKTGAVTLAKADVGLGSVDNTADSAKSVASAATLTTARTINGTSFNGSANITTDNWGTARNLTIGNASKSVNGSDNVSWTLAEIGATSAKPVLVTSNITLAADADYHISGDRTLTLPTGSAHGSRIRIVKEIGSTVAINRGGSELIKYSGGTDTSVIYNIDAEIVFVRNGAGQWEI